MRTSTPGTPNNRGFTLVELAIVLFVLGLMLWVAVPRLAHVGEPDRETVFRTLSVGSEAAYDISLFEKRETRLVIDPTAGTYEFKTMDRPGEEKHPRQFGARLSLTGIRIEGVDRPMDLPTEIRYLPGGRVPAARLFFRDAESDSDSGKWTLRLNPFDGSMKVLEGTVQNDG